MSDSIPCTRCGTLVPVDPMEIQTVQAAFGKAPLVLCDWCEQGKEDAVASAPARPLPDWPENWPQRAIRDLASFTGEPLAKARQILPKLAESGTIAIIGDRGRGKTVMATWFAHQRRLQNKNPGTYVRSHDLFATIRRAWHPQSKDDEWTVLERYRATALLIIDEFQERSDSEWENRTLVNILDHRHAGILPTLIIANLTKAGFVESVGPSLADRIAQTGGVVECSWGNLRS